MTVTSGDNCDGDDNCSGQGQRKFLERTLGSRNHIKRSETLIKEI